LIAPARSATACGSGSATFAAASRRSAIPTGGLDALPKADSAKRLRAVRHLAASAQDLAASAPATALTRSRDPDAPQETWLIFYGDVRVGAIAERTGNPPGTDGWQWHCGFYPGGHARE